ncbi:hypothetical protein [Specibacter sp. RAF43]|uniref:hypothetical protein n=1 Tax=Specibacter sp. RAF43 TaxID=3233057 RepID=UPI003F981DC6
MSWWSWILLWMALVALSLLFIVVMGLKLWRDAARTMRGVGRTRDSLSAHWEEQSRAAAQRSVPEPRTTLPGAAVFATPEQMKDDYLAAKEARQFVRRQRRVARRKERGQLQSLRDIRALEDVG